MKYLAILLIALSLPASADERFFGFGVGTANSAKSSAGETKIGHAGIRYDIWNGIYWQNKIGYWGDGSGDPTRKNSAYIASGFGLLIDLRPVEIKHAWSLAAISTPDSYLGGRFPQFNGEIYLGVRDRRGNGIGVQYEHVSSAGLVTPNSGRDFFVLQISQKW